jgi:hypothetical protein
MGLPRVGKTTFLAAFWHVLISEEVTGALELSELQPSREHLNAIAKLWRQWKELPRTTMPKERFVSMNLQILGKEEVYELTIPDSSGEAFRRMFEMRRCSVDFERLASEAEGILFFIHPKFAIPPEMIDQSVDDISENIDATLALEESGTEAPEVVKEASSLEGETDEVSVVDTLEATGGENFNEPTLKWTPRLSCYQAKVVDLLQIARNFRRGRPTRLAIVISAWDVCEIEKLSPEAWLQKRLPLCFQYLKANETEVPFAIYGVSAQGAELTKPGELVNLIRASDRIRVVVGAKESKDISIPIRDLLLGEQETNK